MKTIVKVKGEKYERYTAGEHFSKTYKGEELAVWRKIADTHGYGGGEDGEHTVEEIRQSVLDINGDGCDYLTHVEENGTVLFTDDSEVENEEVDC